MIWSNATSVLFLVDVKYKNIGQSGRY
jgi:hypothetical protein